MSVCAFFGHSECYGLDAAMLRNAIEDLIKQAYLERIRPFFVLENPDTLDLSKLNIKKIWVNDDSAQDVQPDQIVFHWDGLLISNMCDSVCMVSYIKINDTEYGIIEMIYGNRTFWCKYSLQNTCNL